MTVFELGALGEFVGSFAVVRRSDLAAGHFSSAPILTSLARHGWCARYADFIKEELGDSYIVNKLAKRMLGESV